MDAKNLDGPHVNLWLDPDAPPLPLPISPDGPRLTSDGLEAFGIDRVAPSLWALTPSLNIPDFIHAFMVLYDAPNPAPWESERPVCEGCRCSDSDPCSGGCSWSLAFAAVGRWVCSRCEPSMLHHGPPEASA
jgi:hypothetical protein